jgi:uncharacterized protein YbjT (DUF2867 family)
MLLQDVHRMSVLRKILSVKIIETLTLPGDHEFMNRTDDYQVLVLGATGKTGSRVAARLAAHGVSVRTAARSGTDVHFDWDNPATWEEALGGATGLYLLSPVLRIDFASLVAQFLDQAERAGVRHVTYLSAYGMDHAPAEVAMRAVELGLAARRSLASTVIRPAWFMEDPQALTMDEAAQLISAAAKRAITYRDTDREGWIAAMVSTGIPAEYAQVLRPLTATVARGNGARPNSDVLEVTGTAPVTFAEFAAKTAPAWK